MKLLTIAATLALARAAVALKVRNYTATYDENEANSGFYGVNITGSYNALHYTNWYSGPYDYESGFPAGVPAVSFPADAAFNAGKGKEADISASYVNSTVKYFTLQNFYFGCNAQVKYNGSFTGPVPNNCTLAVSAYSDKGSSLVAQQTFHYRPNVQRNPNTGAPYALQQEMTFIPAFQKTGIRYVVFSAIGKNYWWGYTGSGPDGQEQYSKLPADPNVQVLFDNFTYSTYSTK